MNKTIIVSITSCARCGGDHKDLAFVKLTRPAPDFEYWAPCPYLGEPIVMTVSADSPEAAAVTAGG